MWEFYEKVRKIPGVIVYGDFSGKERCPIVTLNFEDVDLAELSDALFTSMGFQQDREFTVHRSCMRHWVQWNRERYGSAFPTIIQRRKF